MLVLMHAHYTIPISVLYIMAVIIDRWSQEYISRKSIQLVYSLVPRPLLVFNVARLKKNKKTEGLLEFHDVMDVVQDDVLE